MLGMFIRGYVKCGYIYEILLKYYFFLMLDFIIILCCDNIFDFVDVELVVVIFVKILCICNNDYL